MARVARTSFWAVPDPEGRRWCARWIDELARRSSGRPFEPHVTIVGDAAAGWTGALVAAAVRDLPPLAVPLVEVDDDDATFRCVTLRAAPAGPSALRARLSEVVTDRADGPFRPHLSVLYGSLPKARRRALLADAGLGTPLPKITVDAVAAWDTTAEDWGAWRELARWPLSGTPR